MTTSLTGRSSIRMWLDHPVGGPPMRGLLSPAGFDESVLAPNRELPLQQLVVMSQNQMPQAAIDGLVAQANGGVMPDEEPAETADVGSARRFAGKTVVVTGAGSGVARETSLRLVRRGSSNWRDEC